MNDNRASHLAMIQGVITRMGTNSFVLKGWNVTMVSALFALAVKDSNSRFILIAFLPALAFWILDAYYLRQERLFRKLFDDVRCSTDDTKNGYEPYSMSIGKYTNEVESPFHTMFAPSVVVLHGTVIVTISVVMIILCCAR